MRNDGLFEKWKAVARMSQTVAQIETEFKKIYEIASGLTGSAALPSLTMPTLVAPPSASAPDLKLVKDSRLLKEGRTLTALVSEIAHGQTDQSPMLQKQEPLYYGSRQP
jgi:hypothetical protein